MLSALALVAALVACDGVAAPTAPRVATDRVAIEGKGNSAFNEKFTFNGETFSDGSSGTIEAGSKRTGNGNTFTTCGYFAADASFLGEYQDATFASSDAATVEQFCLDHFTDRQ